ncbi:hypothetical protein GOP47_0002819 [Adiantum capillus-veneris]|uniref:Haloacid dehalogenase-like hydrolase domain-containing protein 3 n=1 Tax=Adiantum capillus-veneris TaxID=13818 RepID=A0A9D4VCC0_ADICA|nr:hypothetical protein GOP47_0002819 [Adiantum capillus-veneris]
MLPFSCKRALQAVAAHRCTQGNVNFILRSRENSFIKDLKNGILRQFSTSLPDCDAITCHQGSPHAKDPLEAARSSTTNVDSLKTLSDPCTSGAEDESHTICATCPGVVEQRNISHSDTFFECDRTFCPPERGETCPLAQMGLLEPRGDQHLMHQLDAGGLPCLKRSLKCPHAYRALFVDAAGTLIEASQSTQQIYHEIGLKYGVKFSEEEIAAKYKAAYGQPWCRYRMRYEEDGRFYWQLIVQEATGCKDPALLEDLYQYYTTEKAWHIGDPEAGTALKAIRTAGIKLAVVSNFDTRLRPLMKALHCYDWFDTIIVSAEVGLEKPNPEIFLTACKELGVRPEQVLHVGDDKTNDLVGASAAGCDSLLWGVEVASFAEVAKKLGVKV